MIDTTSPQDSCGGVSESMAEEVDREDEDMELEEYCWS